ncbi:recombinase RecF [Wohlfahrtiimonas chitiniclastica]|uniref:AAA family ATPase n=1 Tax=Wohlfahrtiimonas chitiniclastica TaxID=400946 RepID=UPI000B986D1B|nr:AAA family ATPase [Wohlfahrtiimonas chitiniclastica]OYQ71758.1 recombinase RecF [Wohlfahrtiimonas chitiniclastica]OYQ79271.1 recombinase RecF [Wohlfahrtiimonas chitiniclastica]
MSSKRPIDSLQIKGFKSIQSLDIELKPMNVLIGSNGSGKSNFVSYFRMLSQLIEGRLATWVNQQGGADRILTFGVKNTDKLTSKINFQQNAYAFELSSTVDDRLIFNYETGYFHNTNYAHPYSVGLQAGLSESVLKESKERIAQYCYKAISNWRIYHFHDTSDTASMKRKGTVHDNKYLRPDASNLAAFLYRLKHEYTECYESIIDTIRLAIPFFDDFVLEPKALPTEEMQIRLLWRQTNSDYELWPSQLSDGSIRFICLVTALMQPEPPSTIIFDEPELGLHPYAITLLGALFRRASERMQVIISTQSVALLNQFNLDEIITVDRENGYSIFKRLDEEQFSAWLDEYTIGELWEKNLLGGRPL